MAIARDNSSVLTSNSGNLANVSINSYVLASGNNALFIGVVNNDDLGSTVTGVTYNSIGLTQLGTKVVNGNVANNSSITFWYGVEGVIGSGTHDITATRDGTHLNGFRIIAASYTGVAQTGTIINPSSPVQQAVHSGTWSNSLTTTVDNSWVVGWMENEDTGSNLSASTGLTAVTAASFGMFFDSNAAITPAGANTFAATTSGTPFWCGYVAGFAPVAAAGPANVKTWDGVTQSTGIKTYNGLALASTKTVIGVA